MVRLLITFLIFYFPQLIYCQKTTSVLSGETYNKKKDITSFILIPYGGVDIPGKWKQYKYLEMSRQYFFVGADSSKIAIAKNPKQKYPFYKSSLSNKEFVSEYYKWESDYYKGNGYEVKTLKDSSSAEYVVWQITGRKVDNVFIYGIKKDLVYNFMVDTKKLTLEERVNFLIKLFRNN